MTDMSAGDLAAEVEKYHWYHTLDLGDGVVTRGWFDHRPVVDRYLIPARLDGLRCLDVGTMDGFWAFEMERRGAADVVAIDLDDPESLDWPASLRDKVPKTLDATKTQRFELAHRSLRSRVERQIRSVYTLDPTDVGLFDVIFCGDLLVHLKDPITAVERMRAVCRGRTILCTPITKVRGMRKRALAALDGVDQFDWWVFTMSALERLAIAGGFGTVDAKTTFKLPARAGGPWKGLRGVVSASV
jgi:tRNA (mo5U34)-methyltransferase